MDEHYLCVECRHWNCRLVGYHISLPCSGNDDGVGGIQRPHFADAIRWNIHMVLAKNSRGISANLHFLSAHSASPHVKYMYKIFVSFKWSLIEGLFCLHNWSYIFEYARYFLFLSVDGIACFQIFSVEFRNAIILKAYRVPFSWYTCFGWSFVWL